jgi:predicted outer membrane repeat protein
MTRLRRRGLALFCPAIETLEGRCLPSTVTNLLDSGLGSLRQAIRDTPAGGTVDFQAGLTGTITLTTGELAIARNLTITGPQADLITVGGNHASRVFDITGAFTVHMAALTIANGAESSVVGTDTSAPMEGGGILNNGTLTLTNCTLRGNAADSGGGISNNGTLTVSNCTFSGNTAGDGGGGILNNGTLTVSSCTFSGNSAADEGGGILNYGTLHTRNTILAANTASLGPDLAGSLGSSGHNLIGNTQGGSGFAASDLRNVGAMLGPLQNNGGPTQTMAPLSGSPAIGAGDPTGDPATDQRGFARNVGSTIDIGAFEFQPVDVVTHLGLHAPASNTAGTAFDGIVTALNDFGQRVVGYVGTLHFILWPRGSTLDYTYTSADRGRHVFTEVLPTARFDTVTAADMGNAPVNGTTTFTVTPASADHLSLTVAPSVKTGDAVTVTVAVEDAYGTTVTDYRGTIHFTLHEPGLDQMLDYSFTAEDLGRHTFGQLVFHVPGMYTLDGSDPSDVAISGTIVFTVSD